jgi:phage baseplate assembly protein V
MAGWEETLRIGMVVSIDENKHTARVQFTDRDNMVSWDLKVLVPSTVDPQDYGLPVEGTEVLCGFLPNGQQQGFIIGAFYTDANPPPIADRNKYLRKFKDGTSIEYDKTTGDLITKTAHHHSVNP